MLLRRYAAQALRTSRTAWSPADTCLVRAQSSAAAASSSSTPAGKGSAGGSASKESISSCPAGTTLSGLNIYKDRAEPVARPDSEYPAWLWTLLDSNKANTDGVVLESTDGLTKGQARIVEKRNIRAIRAAHRAKQEAASRAATIAQSGAGMNAVGRSSQGIVGDAAASAEAKAAEAATVIDFTSQERARKRELRAANRENIKAKNFVKAR